MKRIYLFIIKLAIKKKAKIFVSKLSDEAKETQAALQIVAKHIQTGKITKEEEVIVKQQFYDVLKLAGVGIPFFLIPGASILLPIIIKIAQKKNIELLPSSFTLHSKEMPKTFTAKGWENVSQEAIEDIKNAKGFNYDYDYDYDIKNFDKLKTQTDRDHVLHWSKITTVTINDDGYYMLDMIPDPGFKDAKLI